MSTRWILGIAAIFFAALLIVFFSDDLNRAAITGSDGFIDSGKKFGIRVGVPRADAASILQRRGLTLGQPSTPGRCLSRDYSREGQSVTLWDDRTWRRGVICIGEVDGKVSSISWAIGGWQL